MIVAIFLCFILFACGLAVLFSYELRLKVHNFFLVLIPHSQKQLKSVRQFAQQLNTAAAPEQIQSHWHLQQWWILIAGFFLFSSILLFAFTRPISPSKIEADYLREVDPQIYALLDGQILSPPEEVEESLIEEAIIAATNIESAQSAIQAETFNSNTEDLAISHSHGDLVSADRKWNKINPRYKQRLLMVFKIMQQRYGYEMVLLEGYRSPERQNSLATNQHVTRAKGFQSYHQFGLAADVAFKRNGKVVISERDPWAMQGYQLYGEVAESVGLTWGGRWKSIQDYGHTEYRLPGLRKTAEMAEQLTSEGQLLANHLN
ncbi:M15 family metallopeptidase [Acinetobacter bouvetii]|uniref:Peptidoglycan L-alanyl-D-glutamate endopeptidase CwlK n=1 Tax=Acinetobacter bouvetii TaxID=202951 RepID=A0A811GHZ6_9GAMM|nr:M15 family metallopeptidase [Acinetobacter bouvetii]CAB1221460.1 Peptidoglycan L-alanyl-D-glutamate endopeptidase CwlK [Acinetobacter bouvetii]